MKLKISIIEPKYNGIKAVRDGESDDKYPYKLTEIKVIEATSIDFLGFKSELIHYLLWQLLLYD